MTFRYLTPARRELDRQMEIYEEKLTGLGRDFLTEVEAAISRVIENPEAWTPVEAGIRRCLTRRFPYAVIYHYRRNEQEILIVAVAHTHQKPGYWKGRLNPE